MSLQNDANFCCRECAGHVSVSIWSRRRTAERHRLPMNTRRVAVLLLFSAVLSCEAIRALTDEKRLPIWSAPEISVRARATAVNRCFTNGTSMRAIVAVLGTNYIVSRPISTVWVGPGPEPRKTSGLTYSFGEECVTIGTTAAINADPLNGEFTGAGYSFRATPFSAQTTIWIRQPDGAANGSQPSKPGTNSTSSAPGSRR